MDKPYHELAKRLACAFISTQLGISLDYCYKNHIKDEDLGDYWYNLAEKVISDMMDSEIVK